MSSFARPSYLTIRSSVCMILIWDILFPIVTISAKLDPVTYVGNLTIVHFISMNKQDAQLGIESVGHIGKDSKGNGSRWKSITELPVVLHPKYC